MSSYAISLPGHLYEAVRLETDAGRLDPHAVCQTALSEALAALEGPPVAGSPFSTYEPLAPAPASRSRRS